MSVTKDGKLSEREYTTINKKRNLTLSKLSISAQKPDNRGTSRTAMLDEPACSHLRKYTEGVGVQTILLKSRINLWLFIHSFKQD